MCREQSFATVPKNFLRVPGARIRAGCDSTKARTTVFLRKLLLAAVSRGFSYPRPDRKSFSHSEHSPHRTIQKTDKPRRHLRNRKSSSFVLRTSHFSLVG